MILKKLFCTVGLFFYILLCAGASFDDLTNDDAGQLIYVPNSGEVLVFQKALPSKRSLNRWQCVPFHGNGTRVLYPDECIILNCTEKSLTPEIVAMELVYWSCQKDKRADAFHRIAARMNAPEINKLLDFYANLRNHAKSVYREAMEYRKALNESKRQTAIQLSRPSRGPSCNNYNSNNTPAATQSTVASVLEAGLKSTLKNTAALKSIQDMAATEKNFFAAFCMFLSYRSSTLNAARLISASFRGDLYDEITQAGNEIRIRYQQERNYNKKRENDFKSLCKGRHGRWEYAPPADLNAMYSFVKSCYTAWQKTQNLSPYSEFPEWGNAMLEVLQMIKKPAWEQKFDTAFAEYQKYNSN